MPFFSREILTPFARAIAFAICCAVVAGLISTMLFAPRFQWWDSYNLPETDRAYDTLRQLENPWAPVPNYVSRVIEWRLLFPLIGHALGLTPATFLKLPVLGCLLTLTYIAYIARRAGLPRVHALAVTILAAFSPWYIVSTGWLAYFDSWLVLCLLIACFSTHSALLAIASLAGPWIDERFVIALPVIFTVRWYWQDKLSMSRTQLVRTLALIAGVAAIYPIVRVFSWSGGSDQVTSPYISDHVRLIQSVHSSTFATGWWMGHRVSWIAFFYFLFDLTHRDPKHIRWFVISGLIGISIALLLIAGDMQRSLEVLFPAVFAGWLRLVIQYPQRAGVILAVSIVLSGLLPASHVLWLETYPIQRFDQEMQRSAVSVPERIDAAIARANQMAGEGDFEGAFRLASDAISFGGELSAAAHSLRSDLYSSQNQMQLAEQDAFMSLRLAPNNPDYLFNCGRIDLQQRRLSDANEKFKAAIQAAPTDWPFYEDCKAALAILERISK